MVAKSFLKTIDVRDEISLDPFYSESNMAYLHRGMEALNAGKGVEHDIIEAEDE